MKQNTQALTQVRIPSKTASLNVSPQSSPGKRSSTQEAIVLSDGSKTSSSTSSSSASHSHTIISVKGSRLTRDTYMPGSIPASYAGESGRTAVTSAP